jgi:Fic family protein
VSPRWEAVRDATPALFDLLASEPEASVRTVLGHWLFGYIHLYPDGNGRMAHFLMKVMMTSGGYSVMGFASHDAREMAGVQHGEL